MLTDTGNGGEISCQTDLCFALTQEAAHLQAAQVILVRARMEIAVCRNIVAAQIDIVIGCGEDGDDPHLRIQMCIRDSQRQARCGVPGC